MNDNANNDPIAAALNLVPMDSIDNQVTKLIDSALNDSAKSDFQKARANILNMIDSGMLSLDRLTQIAAQSQHPRAFEVISTMINTLLAANKDLLELQTKIREIDKSDSPTGNNPQVINNNLFVGSTHELLKTLKSMNNGNTDVSG